MKKALRPAALVLAVPAASCPPARALDDPCYIAYQDALNTKTRGNTEQGLCDLAGNAAEWTGDRSVRGGSWAHTPPDRFRAASRSPLRPDQRGDFLGLRVVR